jgi:hypothetical protein
LGYRRQDQPWRDYYRREQGMHLIRIELGYYQEATGHQHSPGRGASDEIPVPWGAQNEDGPYGPEKGDRQEKYELEYRPTKDESGRQEPDTVVPRAF